MTIINPHTTRGTGTILTAAIYNADHNNHVTNAQNLNSDKLERSGVVVPGNLAIWVGDEALEDGGTPGTMALEDAADYAALASANTFTADQTVRSVSDAATEGPLLRLYRNSPGPANNDLIGAIPFIGRNDASQDVEYAKLLAMIANAGDGIEAAELQWHTMVAGTIAQRMRLRQGLRLGSPTGGDLGEGTINATELYKNGVHAWTGKYKAADESRVNNTLAVDDTLFFAMLASTKYAIRGKVFFTTAVTPDMEYRMLGPASPTLLSITRKAIAPSALTTLTSASVVAYDAADVTLTGGTTGGYLEFDGIIHNGVNAGNFEFHWAQGTTNATPTTVLAGSYIEYRQL